MIKKKCARTATVFFPISEVTEGMVSPMRLFLMLCEAQSSEFIPVCKQAEMFDGWRSGLTISILGLLTFISFVPFSFVVVMMNPTDVYKHM